MAKTVTVMTPYATLSFPVLFTPKPRAPEKEPEYGAVLLFDDTAQRSPEFKAMQAAVKEVAVDRFGAQVNFKSLRLPFRDAGEKADKYQGYEEGVVAVSAYSKNKPGIVDARLQQVLLPEQVYAGQLVRAQLNCFAYDVSGNKGVSFGLNHIQIVKHDAPRIDGRVSAEKAFSVIEDADEEVVPF